MQMMMSNKYSSPSVDDVFPRASPSVRNSIQSPDTSIRYSLHGGSEKTKNTGSFVKDFLKEHQKFMRQQELS